jgi:Undecaprenyl-phosphate glucose phosphotransferase
MPRVEGGFLPDPTQRDVRQRASLIRWTHGLINRSVMTLDGLLIVASSMLFWAVSSAPQRSLTGLQTATIGVVIAIAFIWLMRLAGAYRVERYGRFWRPLADLLRAFLPALVVAAIILRAFSQDAWQQPGWFETWAVTMFCMLALGRQATRLALRIVDHRALLRRRVVVVGAGTACEEIVAHLKDPRYANDYTLVGVFDRRTSTPQSYKLSGVFDRRTSTPQSPAPSDTPGTADTLDLIDYAQNYAIDLVIIALPWTQSEEIFKLIQRLQWIAADVVVPFAKTGFRPQIAPPIDFIDAPILQVMHRPFKGSQGLIKVAEDYIVATTALLLVWPIMLLAALAIRLEGSGPILFRQARVGFNSKPFMMFKFRTMTVDPSDDGSQGTYRNTQRITPVGKFLRRTSIDELPQLINVLRGEMSIVGPRPHVANMLVGEGVYAEIVRQYAARHRIKPGITGWAQINGMRGGIDSLAKASRGADLDLYYIANWSLRLDMKIMIRTVVAGLVGRDVF